MSKISIIIPVYKTEKYLHRCLDSVINQTYQNIEVILVDDGSPDKSGEICDEYANKDERIKVIHKNNAGVTEARISGLQNCTGDYIAFVDSDDYVSPYYIEHLYDCIIKYGVSISYCQKELVLSSGKRRLGAGSRLSGLYDEKRVLQMLKENFLLEYSMGVWGKLYSRKVLDNNALEVARGLWIGEDLITNLYIMYQLPSLYISPERLYFYVQHRGQATVQADLSSWRNQVEQWKRIIKLDKLGYLNNQLPYRIFRFFRLFLKLNAANLHSRQAFGQNVASALKPDIVHQAISYYNFKNMNFPNKILLIFIRKKWYTFIYCVFKVLLVPYRLFK